MSVCWGILSTARINEKVLAGAKASEAVAMIAMAEVERVYIEELYRSADASTPGLLAERSSA